MSQHPETSNSGPQAQDPTPRNRQAAPADLTSERTPNVLTNSKLKLQFGRFRSGWTRIDLQINIDAIERVAGSVRVMEFSLGGILVAPITRANFIRVTKTLILRRLQDVVESFTCQRSPQTINIGRGTSVPEPIGELLYALGNYYCDWNGIQYALSEPPPPVANPPAFYTVDAAILSGFITFCRLATHYKMVPFPKMSDTIVLPLMLLTKNEHYQVGQVRSMSMIPTQPDCYLRFVHEELFVQPPFDWND